MGPVRSAVMWQAVLDAVAVVGGDAPLRVVDLGGGTGGDAVRLAGLGHDVSVVDPSPDALAALARRAAESSGSVTGLLGDATDLPDLVEPASVDLVVCHGVLEHVDDPAQALAGVVRVLRPRGVASVVVAGRHAGVTARALAGDFDGAARLFATTSDAWDIESLGPRRFTAAELDALVRGSGFAPTVSHALRVFSDLVPSALVDIEPGARDSLFALERQVRDDPAFTALSAGLQLIAVLDSEVPRGSVTSPAPSHGPSTGRS